jgi:hypothetical protein
LIYDLPHLFPLPKERTAQRAASAGRKIIRQIQSSDISRMQGAFHLLPGGEGRDEGGQSNQPLSVADCLITKSCQFSGIVRRQRRRRATGCSRFIKIPANREFIAESLTRTQLSPSRTLLSPRRTQLTRRRTLLSPRQTQLTRRGSQLSPRQTQLIRRRTQLSPRQTQLTRRGNQLSLRQT